MKPLLFIVATFLSASAFTFQPQQTGRERLDQIEQTLQADVPRVLCLTDSFATGGQPTEQAFTKLAANGFHAVLNLRTAAEGVDLDKERRLVEQSGMRYINIPVVVDAPRPEQADEFIQVVKDKTNHPMLIHCRSASRVGAFMMIYRVVEQGWSEEKAEEEAVRIGLHTEGLKKFAKDYIAQQKAKKDGSRVKSIYVGRGEIAHMISMFESNSAELEKLMRAKKSIQAHELEKVEVALDRAVELIHLFTQAALLTAGFHTHHRQWRRKRNVA